MLFVKLDSLTNTSDEMSVIHQNFAEVLNRAELENESSDHWSLVVHELLYIWVNRVTNQLIDVNVLFDNSVNDLSGVLKVGLLKFSSRVRIHGLNHCRHWFYVWHWNCLSQQIMRVVALGTESAFACNEVLALLGSNPGSRGSSQSCCDLSGHVVDMRVLSLDCHLLYAFSAWDESVSIDV